MKRRVLTPLLMLTLAVLLLLAAGCSPKAPSEPPQATADGGLPSAVQASSPNETEPAPIEAAAPKRGPGDFDLTDPSAGLDGLSSYHQKSGDRN